MFSFITLHPFLFTLLVIIVIAVIASIIGVAMSPKKFTTPSKPKLNFATTTNAVMDARFETPEFLDDRSDAQSDRTVQTSLHRSDRQQQRLAQRANDVRTMRKMQFASATNAYDEQTVSE